MSPRRVKGIRCPVCGQFGARGPYHKWVKNGRGVRYGTYDYYRHGTEKTGYSICNVRRKQPVVSNNDNEPDFERLKELAEKEDVPDFQAIKDRMKGRKR
ncbi:MAG: hypothetical protein KGI38_12545 [Thaumarchaeota archaeon]|nr:hypothetical protein [Nitrososphaerota archaeon]